MFEIGRENVQLKIKTVKSKLTFQRQRTANECAAERRIKLFLVLMISAKFPFFVQTFLPVSLLPSGVPELSRFTPSTLPEWLKRKVNKVSFQ